MYVSTRFVVCVFASEKFLWGDVTQIWLKHKNLENQKGLYTQYCDNIDFKTFFISPQQKRERERVIDHILKLHQREPIHLYIRVHVH